MMTTNLINVFAVCVFSTSSFKVPFFYEILSIQTIIFSFVASEFFSYMFLMELL